MFNNFVYIHKIKFQEDMNFISKILQVISNILKCRFESRTSFLYSGKQDCFVVLFPTLKDMAEMEAVYFRYDFYKFPL